MKQRLLILILLLIGQFSYSQSIMLPGFVVTQEKDTLTGYLKDDLDKDLIKAVSFSSHVSGEDSKQYTATDIIGFGYASGRGFESIESRDNSTRVFAKRLADGKIKVLLEK